MENKDSSQMTLGEHAIAFYKSHGLEISLLDTPEGMDAYRLWVDWAFSNMRGNTKRKQEEALKKVMDYIRIQKQQ